jgi:NRPS condensation-like uncharacterized protein
MDKTKQFQEELNNSGLISIFEIEVINKQTNKTDYIIIDITIENGKIKGQRPVFYSDEQNSKYIAKTEIEIDEVFSLDEHLQELYNAIIQDIINSEFYDLPADDTEPPETETGDIKFYELNPEYKEHPESEYFKSE